MSSSLLLRPTSFWGRLTNGRLQARDVMSIVLVGTGACAVALFGLDALLVSHPVQAESRARAAAPSDAFTLRDLGPYVGNWVSGDGAHLIVAKSGAVWADAGGLNGAARLDGGDRTRLLFEGADFRCSYRISADRPGGAAGDGLTWTLVDGTPGTVCPAGHYTRRFTF